MLLSPIIKKTLSSGFCKKNNKYHCHACKPKKNYSKTGDNKSMLIFFHMVQTHLFQIEMSLLDVFFGKTRGFPGKLII